MAAAKGKKILPAQPDALDVLAAEASDTEFLTVPLAGKDIRVKDPMDWPSSAMRAMREGNFEVWAEKCLEDGDYTIWQSVDPTYRQIAQFMAAYRDAGGREPGE
jgi:hypothetical protein